MLDYNVYVEQALEMIKLLKNSNLNNLNKDRQLFDATAMRVQVIGEAIKKIPKEIKKRYSHISWDSLIKTRDFVSHNYELIDSNIMKVFILKRIFLLEEDLKKILKEENKK